MSARTGGLIWPDGFRWATATAAYQIEGAATEDGRGPSVWDTFSHEPGKIKDGATGDVACDHYHRYADDVRLMADLGLDAYRFSVSWSRIQPTGEGPANPAGLAFYDRLVDALLDAGIDPLLTLFHWDLPQALQDKGGWTNRDTAARFGEYADLVAAALGDRVKLWMTLNEPFVHTALGHVLGTHAPGQQLVQPFSVIHHLLLGHGLAAAAIRRNNAVGGVTVANNYSPGWAVGPDGTRGSASEDDEVAASLYEAFHLRMFADPLLLGEYPPGAELLSDVDLDSLVLDGDLAVISAPLDAYGLNYYNPVGIGAPGPEDTAPFTQVPLTGFETTDFGWPIVPDQFRDALIDLHRRYPLPPLWITENGCSYDDPAQPDGSIVDSRRIAYLDAHIAAVHQAMAAGVDVRGYCVWSLMDNFEWAEGFTQRFGLVHVDYDTLARTPRASYGWYRDLIRASRGIGPTS